MVALGLGLGLTAQQNIAINATGAAADNSAILDISVAGLSATGKKGFLMPRMTLAQRGALTTVAGLTIYQTDNTPGFYYYNGLAWVRLTNGSPGWGILGNDLVDPADDWIGTTDGAALTFRTNNVEHIRIDGATGRVGMGNIAPTERLEVTGAIKLSGTSATNTLGTIRWNDTDSLHEGYMGATNGWRKLQNDYTFVQNAAYTQQATATCAPGTSWIPDNVATIAANFTVDERVTPFPNSTTNAKMRHQYLFLKNELDVELNQLNGNTTITHGICAGQPITTLAFEKAAGGAVKNWQYQVSIFHVPFGVNSLIQFEPNADPSFACFSTPAAVPWPTAVGAGLQVVTLSSPFIWDGVRNIVIEICGTANFGAGSAVPVKFTTVSANLTFSKNAGLAVSPCGNPGLTPCAPNAAVGACDMPSGVTCIPNGVSGAWNQRPVIRFGGTVSSTTGPANFGNDEYIQYPGGFLIEATPLWRFWNAPPIIGASDPYDAFQGPGHIHAENGVYDNGVQLSDHVFDRHFDGRVRLDDLERAGAHHNLSIDEMSRFTEVNRHLPTMKGRTAWERENGFSFGDLSNQLWVTTETQALYLTDLNRKAHLLEALSTNRAVRPDEVAPMTGVVKAMTDLTEGQKRLLVQDLNQRAQNAPNTSR